MGYGGYFPWPWRHDGICPPMVESMNPIDNAVCFLASTGLIVLVIALDVVLLALIGRYIGKRIERWREERS